MTELRDIYTSTGYKFFAHQEVMTKLRNKQGQPVVTHLMLTDICNHTCAFCSVQARQGDTLDFKIIMRYLVVLMKYGLKAVILSGGGNPILYKCKKTGETFTEVVNAIHSLGLEIGLITNGMPMRTYESEKFEVGQKLQRESWKGIRPEILDKLTWIRISMAGLDHEEREVYVPDIDYNKTALGFSYVAHDIYNEPADPYHGKVSTKADLLTNEDRSVPPDRPFEMRIEDLTRTIAQYVNRYHPRYVRLLPNCLEPSLISRRATQLEDMSKKINAKVGYNAAFVQNKPPSAPHACYLGYIHPVLNCDGYVYPCDSCVLNETANHQFANPWRVCHWSEVEKLYTSPVRSLIADPKKTCPGCVFTNSNEMLREVVEGKTVLASITGTVEHVNFV